MDDITTFVHVGDVVRFIGYEPNILRCDNWNYEQLIGKKLTGTIREIHYGTNPVKEKTKAYVRLELDTRNAKKIPQFCRCIGGRLVPHHFSIMLTNPILKFIKYKGE